jgi:chromosome segregation protein
MRLKRVELSGFKSFVDPVRIDIGKGITSIVGPNGCGKSNIVDAIRWVLGEHSAKHLRGGVMDDLIFQGSDSRPPVAVCDVELTFAIEKGQLPSPYHEMNEIRIRRRLTRDGGSDAFINGKMVRLKDIVDLFLDTGISTRAYAIVEQGAIARMITSKPEERRLLLEEAAGVMKYRARRREAERKMNSTRQNLERATDLLEEVRSQCRSLRQQASRAERFKAMQEESAEVQAKAYGIRYRQQQAQVAAIARELAEAAGRMEEATGQHTRAERLLSQARRAMVDHESEAQASQDALREAERRRAELQQQAERLAGERRLLSERREGLRQRIEETGGRHLQVGQELEELKLQLEGRDDAELQERRSHAAEAVEQARTALAQARLRRDELFSEYERLRSEFDNIEKRRQQADAALQRLTQRRATVEAQLNDARERAATIEAQKDEALHLQEEAELRQQQAEEALEAAQQALDSCRAAGQQAAAARAESEQAVRSLRGQAQELRAQLQQQDMPESLREQMRARGAVWVDESLQVPEGMEQAVAAALRGRAADASIAGGDLGTWRDYCSEASSAPVAWHAPQLNRQKPNGNSLSAAIGLDAAHPLHGMFAHVELCDDIFSATPPPQGCLVSRDGWRLEHDGWLIPPAQSHTARRLGLKRQLHETESALTKAEKALAMNEAQVAEQEESLTRHQQQWQQAHLAATESKSAVQSAAAHARRLEEEAGTLTSRLQHLQEELEAVERDSTNWKEQQENIGGMDRERLGEAQGRLEEQSAVQQQCEQRLQHENGTLANAEQALALHKQAIENLQRETDRLQHEQERLQLQVERDREQLQQTEEQIAQSADHSDLDMQLQESSEKVETTHQQLNELRQQGHALQQQVHNSERGEREARQALQQLNEARQKVEVRKASEEARLQDMGEEIGERCQCSPAELLKRCEDIPDDQIEEILRTARELEDRLARFGPVNLLAIDEFKEASEREQFLAEQAGDLEESLATLTDTINRIDRTTRQRFRDVFNETNALFQKTFPRLFGGGRAELKLDSDDVLTAGVEVIAQPPGKRLQDITLLSGGEKALTAVALVFSIFQIKPAPFCILDEVDAPLDDANVGRFGEMIHELSDRVQFLAISHNKITMQRADRLIGVSMPEPGVSRIVAVDMENLPV